MSDADRASRDDAAPAEALSDVWLLLDELPRGRASATLQATTIEMAAVQTAGPTAADTGGTRWLVPAAVVAAALVAGWIVGRATAPDPDRTLLEHLPLVRHLDIVREAGSVGFLEQVAGRGGPPLRLALRQGPEAARQEVADFSAAVESLGRLLRADTAARRGVLAALPVEERAELERSLREFTALSGAERKTLAAVAAGLVDPARPELRTAALDWHRWLTVSRPEDRADIVASGTEKRLDWIDWYAARIEGRARPGGPDWPPGLRRPPGGDRPWWQQPRNAEPGAGPPRPPFRPDAPPPPPETRTPPD